MYYKKIKKNPFPILTEPTYAEKITGRFDMKELPTKKQVNRLTVSIVLAAIFTLCHCMGIHACEPQNSIEMDHGAGRS